MLGVLFIFLCSVFEIFVDISLHPAEVVSIEACVVGGPEKGFELLSVFLDELGGPHRHAVGALVYGEVGARAFEAEIDLLELLGAGLTGMENDALEELLRLLNIVLLLLDEDLRVVHD